MSKITIPLVLAGLTSLLLAVPITDNKNQRSAFFPIIGHQNNHVNTLRMRPITLRDRTGLDCPKAGFFVNPRNCSRFYRCVDVASTGYFSIFNFECNQGQVFYQDTSACVPGICSTTGLPVQSVQATSPTPPPPVQGTSQTPSPPVQGTSQTPSPPLKNPSVILPPGTPPPPPSPSPPPTTETQQLTIPQWLNELPPWFKDSPWWFKTAPSWFHQPPAWFNAPPAAQVIPEEIYIDGGDPQGSHIDVVTGMGPSKIVKEITTDGNISIGGIDNTLLHDNKTIRIHIPIHIVQQ